MLLIRPPAVAGAFYNLNPELLKRQVERCFKHELGPKKIKEQKVIAAVIPHAGYEFSGAVAAWAFSRMKKSNFMILGPNHHGIGSKFAIMKNGLWKTPLGGIVVKEDTAEKIVEKCKIIEHDVLAHQSEHSIEVQLPFLQYRFGSDFKFIPISITSDFADETLLESCRLIGKCVADAVKKEDWIIIASSDFSHYVSKDVAKKTDKYVINAIQKLNEKDFFARINEKNASVCGFGPIAVTIAAAKELGAKKAELLKYATSGDVTGEAGAVVGYASIIIY